jgi:hypothetical protein
VILSGVLMLGTSCHTLRVMQNEDRTKRSVLWEKFRVTTTGIELRDSSPSLEEFITAAEEFCGWNDHRMSRLGDLLILCEKAHDREGLRDLVNRLATSDKKSAKTCDNVKSFADRYKEPQRWPRLADSHADAIISIQDRAERGKLVKEIEKTLSRGGKVTSKQVLEMVKKVKKRLGEPITRSRKPKS